MQNTDKQRERQAFIMTAFDGMSKEELKCKLTEMKDLLAEVIEERSIILGQRNLHLSSKLVTKYAKEIQDIEGKIAVLESLLKS